MTTVAPIKEPQRIYAGQYLYTVFINKITKNETKFSSAIIGNTIQFAAIKKIKVLDVTLNDRETGIIVNKSAENIPIPFDVESLASERDGAVFDEEKKAQVVAKSINITNIEKLKSLEEEIASAKSFLQQLIEQGA